ncbi:MAG: hypothetical protein CUN55_17380 [Phototrophicales bacterium]|nr:MAG: hypothetical protein CUN55_17380 [Phototrophicales bacterium]
MMHALRAMMSRQRNPNTELPMNDTSETIHISSLALIKMLIHGRAGVPMEVMGLMLGRYIDEYTVQVVDVFAMPQSGTTVSVESVDEAFQVSHTSIRVHASTIYFEWQPNGQTDVFICLWHLFGQLNCTCATSNQFQLCWSSQRRLKCWSC